MTANTDDSRTLALVGGGNWGKNLARSFYSQGLLHTLCDLNEEHLKTYAEKYPEVKLTTDFQSVLKQPKITKVAIATPPPTHYALVKQALLAGKDVFVEKPLCMDMNEGLELAHLAEKQGLVLMTGHIMQYHPIINMIQEIVKEQLFGPLISIQSKRFNPLSFYKEEDVLWDLGPHDISLILSFCGNAPLKNICYTEHNHSQGGVLDALTFHMDFESGFHADVGISRLSPIKQQKIELTCSKAVLVFDDTKIWHEKLAILSHEEHKLYNHRLKVYDQMAKIPQLEPLKRECDHFRDCCEKRKKAITCAHEAINVVNILQTVHHVIHPFAA